MSRASERHARCSNIQRHDARVRTPLRVAPGPRVPWSGRIAVAPIHRSIRGPRGSSRSRPAREPSPRRRREPFRVDPVARRCEVDHRSNGRPLHRGGARRHHSSGGAPPSRRFRRQHGTQALRRQPRDRHRSRRRPIRGGVNSPQPIKRVTRCRRSTRARAPSQGPGATRHSHPRRGPRRNARTGRRCRDRSMDPRGLTGLTTSGATPLPAPRARSAPSRARH